MNLQRCDVVLLNDDQTPMEFVVVVLERFFGMTRPEAETQMLLINYEGRAICGTYPAEEAEKKVADVLAFAGKHKHYNVSLSERINSFHLQLPEIASAKALNISHSPAGQQLAAPASVIFTRATSIILPSAIMRSGVRTQAPRSPDQPKRQSIAASDLPCSSSRSERLPGLGA